MKKLKTFVKNLFSANRAKLLAMMLLFCTLATFAQSSAGDYTAGTNALSTVTEEIAKYIPYVVKLCYAIAGVVAVVGAISVYIAMNNEEQDVKKKIMMVVGACIFLVAAAQALPLSPLLQCRSLLIISSLRHFSFLLKPKIIPISI